MPEAGERLVLPAREGNGRGPQNGCGDQNGYGRHQDTVTCTGDCRADKLENLSRQFSEYAASRLVSLSRGVHVEERGLPEGLQSLRTAWTWSGSLAEARFSPRDFHPLTPLVQEPSRFRRLKIGEFLRHLLQSLFESAGRPLHVRAFCVTGHEASYLCDVGDFRSEVVEAFRRDALLGRRHGGSGFGDGKTSAVEAGGSPLKESTAVRPSLRGRGRYWAWSSQLIGLREHASDPCTAALLGDGYAPLEQTTCRKQGIEYLIE